MSVESMLKTYAANWNSRCSGEDALMQEKAVMRTIERSKAAFLEGEADREVSRLEFLYSQAACIQKRWWLAQGLVLVMLWAVLYLSGSSIYTRRCTGILMPCFVILLMPELWKNRDNHALEVECAAYFPLHSIYAARLVLFGMADICLLSIFFAVSAFTVQIAVMDFLVQFILPFNVTCCICFQALRSKKNLSIVPALMFCMAWVMVWVFFVLNNGVYERISIPVWFAALTASFAFLCYSVLRICRKDQNTELLLMREY